MSWSVILAFLAGAFLMSAIDAVSYKRKLARLEEHKESERKEEQKTD